MHRLLSSVITTVVAMPLMVLFLGAVGPVALAQTSDCWPGGTPLGALPPARPIWCAATGTGPSTFVQGPNSWLDAFDNGLSNADLGPGYQVFDSQEMTFRTQHFRHNGHWMMDLAPKSPQGEGLLGGGMMRPDRSFGFQDGRLVIEADVAAGLVEYGSGSDIWPEIVVTDAPAPTGTIPDGLYAYGQFGGYWSFGCRLQPTRDPVCALYNPDGRPGDPDDFGTDAGRVFEMSWFQQIGREVYGGYPSNGLENAWRVCQVADPDTACRDRFRLELTKDSVTLYVNGTLYFRQAGLPAAAQLPDELVNGDVYTYFAGWQGRQDAPSIRFHWGRLAVNPDDLPTAAGDGPRSSPASADHESTDLPGTLDQAPRPMDEVPAESEQPREHE